MRSRFLTLLAAALTLATAAAQAPAQDKINDWPEGGAMHTGYLFAERRDHFAKLLQKRNAELLALVKSSPSTDERLLQALSAQHVAWLKYKDAECELLGALSGAGGTWPSTHAVRCEANLTDLRWRSVSSAVRCIRRLPVANRAVEQSLCLYQLGPLTTGK